MRASGFAGPSPAAAAAGPRAPLRLPQKPRRAQKAALTLPAAAPRCRAEAAGPTQTSGSSESVSWLGVHTLLRRGKGGLRPAGPARSRTEAQSRAAGRSDCGSKPDSGPGRPGACLWP